MPISLLMPARKGKREREVSWLYVVFKVYAYGLSAICRELVRHPRTKVRNIFRTGKENQRKVSDFGIYRVFIAYERLVAEQGKHNKKGKYAKKSRQ